MESPATILILGLMFGYAAQAFVTVLVAGTDPDKLQRWVAWGFGSFSGVSWPKMAIFGPLILAGLGVSAVTTKQLNALLLGESYAGSMGLNVRRMRILTMGGASILAGVVTAFCGPVAFLGIAIPHMCRGLLGTSDHRSLVPATILMGGIVALTRRLSRCFRLCCRELRRVPLECGHFADRCSSRRDCSHAQPQRSVYGMSAAIQTIDLAVGYKSGRLTECGAGRIEPVGPRRRTGLPAWYEWHR